MRSEKIEDTQLLFALVDNGYVLKESPKYYNGTAYFYLISADGTKRKSYRITLTKEELEEVKKKIKMQMRIFSERAYYTGKRETRKEQQSYGEIMAELEHHMVEMINISSKHQELFFRALSSAGIYGFIIAISTGKIAPRELSKVIEEWKDDPKELARFIERRLATIAEAAKDVTLVEKLKKENEILKKELEEKNRTIKHLKAVNYELSTQLNGIASMLTPSQLRRFNEWMITRSIAELKYTTISAEDIEPEFSSISVNITVVEHDSTMENMINLAKFKYAWDKLNKEFSPPHKELPHTIKVEFSGSEKLNELSSEFQKLKNRIENIEQSVFSLENSVNMMEKLYRDTRDTFMSFSKKSTENFIKLKNEVHPLISIKHLKEKGFKVYPPYWDDAMREMEYKINKMREDVKHELKKETDKKIADMRDIITEAITYFFPSLGKILYKTDNPIMKELGNALISFRLYLNSRKRASKWLSLRTAS